MNTMEFLTPKIIAEYNFQNILKYNKLPSLDKVNF